MRTLRTIIMGSMMIIPGLVLGLLVWYLTGRPESEPLETLICNGIPLASIGSGFTLDGKRVKNTAQPTKDEWCREAPGQGRHHRRTT